ncbi:hypothetical protein SS50377_24772 [Spironucleus salmonicida]|uniref:Uncharacterized protein n=1 Tax=Spironucleus salmonicida TaxID=348837 RepID=V6LLK2_9EUKA|nr:hypothetical protein SS50377_24772 [Spironucleus salmonicida]|eukprot:EST44651.1 Hypothetical protein SS50377_15660 [Spironucleus salmonicida]
MEDLTSFLLKEQDISQPKELLYYLNLLNEVIQTFCCQEQLHTLLLEQFDINKEIYLPEFQVFEDEKQQWIEIFQTITRKTLSVDVLMNKGARILASFLESARPIRQQILVMCVKLIHKASFQQPFISSKQFYEEVSAVGSLPESITNERIVTRRYALLIKLMIKFRANKSNDDILIKRCQEENIVYQKDLLIILSKKYQLDVQQISDIFTNDPSKFILADYYGFHLACIKAAEQSEQQIQVQPTVIVPPLKNINQKETQKIHPEDIEMVNTNYDPEVIDFEDLSLSEDHHDADISENEPKDNEIDIQPILPSLPTIVLDEEIIVVEAEKCHLPEFTDLEEFLAKIKMDQSEFENLLYETDLILSLNNMQLSKVIQEHIRNNFIYQPDNKYFKKSAEIPLEYEEISYYLNNDNSLLPQLSSLLPLRTTLLNFITHSFSQKLYLQSLEFNAFLRQFFDEGMMQNLLAFRKTVSVQQDQVSFISSELNAQILIRLAQYYEFIHSEHIQPIEVLIKICQFAKAQNSHIQYIKYSGPIYKITKIVQEFPRLKEIGLSGEKFQAVKSAFQLMQVGLQVTGIRTIVQDILDEQI